MAHSLRCQPYTVVWSSFDVRGKPVAHALPYIVETAREQIGEGGLMVNWEAFPSDVASIIHAHPSQNESIGEAAMALAGKPLHVHN